MVDNVKRFLSTAGYADLVDKGFVMQKKKTHDDLSSNPQHTHKNLDKYPIIPALGRLKRRIPKAYLLCSMRNHVSKIKGES